MCNPGTRSATLVTLYACALATSTQYFGTDFIMGLHAGALGGYVKSEVLSSEYYRYSPMQSSLRIDVMNILSPNSQQHWSQ